MSFKIPNISIAGGPTVDWNFTTDVAHAECGGAKAYAEMRHDGCADLTVRTATGQLIADVVVRKMPADESITVSVMNVGTALLWSHARWFGAAVTQGEREASGIALTERTPDPVSPLSEHRNRTIEGLLTAIEQHWPRPSWACETPRREEPAARSPQPEMSRAGVEVQVRLESMTRGMIERIWMDVGAIATAAEAAVREATSSVSLERVVRDAVRAEVERVRREVGDKVRKRLEDHLEAILADEIERSGIRGELRAIAVGMVRAAADRAREGAQR